MFSDGRIDDRKRRILKAIIDEYIDTAEPIGSRTIARRHELGLSSATIRNEMADLEEMGFLAQPHASAGRVPSDKGYRLYVDHLMGLKELTLEEMESIKGALEVKINEISQLISLASAIVSKITRYTSIAATPQIKKVVLKAVQVVPVEPGKALTIVVTNAGIVKNCLVKLPFAIQPDSLIKMSHLLNEKLSGKTLESINLGFAGEVEREIGVPASAILPLLEGVAECINQVDESQVYLDGATNIFNYPEFKDVIKAKEFLSLLSEKQNVEQLLRHYSLGNALNVQIGSENGIEEMKDCTLITATYSFGNSVIGSIGVIGPTRMEYARVISSMSFIRKKINQEIYKLIGEFLDK